MDVKGKKMNITMRSGVKKELKSVEPKSRTLKAKVSTRETKDSQIEKLKCLNSAKDVSIDILHKDILVRNKRFKSLKIQIDDSEDEIDFLNIVIIDKDSKISKLEKEIFHKNTHIENIKTKLSDQVRTYCNS